jgi:hypothetical protein
MSVPLSSEAPRHSIVRTERGWLLVIQNEECSVMQVFSSESSARLAVERMLEFFQDMKAQDPDRRAA